MLEGFQRGLPHLVPSLSEVSTVAMTFMKIWNCENTPTLSTDADSKTDTILRGYIICIIFFFLNFSYIIFSFFGLSKKIGGLGGGNERPQTHHVIRGPMRGLNLTIWSEGQWKALKKIVWEGDKQRTNANARTSRLLDQLGPEGRVGENTQNKEMVQNTKLWGRKNDQKWCLNW